MIPCSKCSFENADTHKQCDRCGEPLVAPARGDDDLERELRALVDKDQIIEAIKLLRERTGVGLKEAKDAIDALRERAVFQMPEPGDVAEAALVDLCRKGRKIEAIKRYRQATGLGLKESKDAVDALCAKHGIPQGAGCSGVLACLFCVVLWTMARHLNLLP